VNGLDAFFLAGIAPESIIALSLSPTKIKSWGLTAMQSIQLADFDRDALRTRLRKMSDEELREFGKAARFMISPSANMGKPPLPTFVRKLVRSGAEDTQHPGREDRCTLGITNFCVLTPP
jgi:hypothetical protein